MLINDGRQCTQLLNEKLFSAQRARSMPKFKGETQYFNNALVFCHYDSRGGSFMLMQDNIIQGIQEYNQEMGWNPNANEGFEDLIEGSGKLMELAVIGGNLEPGELLFDYSGNYIAFRIQLEYETNHPEGGTEIITTDTNWMALVQISEEQREKICELDNSDDFEEADRLKEEYIMSLIPEFVDWNDTFYKSAKFEVWELGEDAFGLYYRG